MDHNFNDMPKFAREYLFYIKAIKNLSSKTVDEYYLDLRIFLKFIIFKHNLSQIKNIEEIDSIDPSVITIDIIDSVSLYELYDYLNYRIDSRHNSPTTRMRKISSLKGLYKYLNKQALIKNNPTIDLEAPKKKKTVPIYLSFTESLKLLESIDGKFKERNLAIITLFLSCGLRLSELVGLNINSIHNNQIRVIGKGNKERILYMNDTCIKALNIYLDIRSSGNIDIKPEAKNAVFISREGNRITNRMVQILVKKFYEKSGIKAEHFSPHKLRHTAATLLHQNGVDIRILQEILGHENLGTTQIYTHVNDAQIEEAMNKNPLNKK